MMNNGASERSARISQRSRLIQAPSSRSPGSPWCRNMRASAKRLGNPKRWATAVVDPMQPPPSMSASKIARA